MKRKISVLTVFVLAAVACFCRIANASENSSATAANNWEANYKWVDARTLVVEGRGWADKAAHFYDRLPADAAGRVRDPIVRLGRNSSGMVVPFATDSRNIAVRWTVRSATLGLPHMPATGVSGLDLYMRDGNNWRWARARGPVAGGKHSSYAFLENLPKGEHQFLLYLPLYNGVESLEIGIQPDSSIEPIVRKEKSVVFYGTSITQGACASRPGMAYTAILGRRLDMPVINLGFSGNGRMEPEAMPDIANLAEPSAFVIDTLPNMQPRQIDTYEAGIALIRERHPLVPIVLVPSIEYQHGWVSPSASNRYQGSNKALRELYARLSASDPNLYLVDVENMLGTDGEATVDGTHPNDIGFVRIADRIEPVLHKALGR